jgi:hypothetical protein
MPRWLFAAAVTTLAVAFATAPARAGWFSSHSGCHDECAPTCAAPCDCYHHAPACGAPTGCYAGPTCATPMDCYQSPTCCAPAAPTCCAPAECGDVCCDGGYQECEREGCFRRCVRRLWDLEKRKNRCLKETFCGWHDRRACNDCAPLEYYQPACGAPYGCH